MSVVTDLLHLALSGAFLPVTASVVVAFLCRRRIRAVWCDQPATDVAEFERYRCVLGERSEVR